MKKLFPILALVAGLALAGCNKADNTSSGPAGSNTGTAVNATNSSPAGTNATAP